MDKVESFPTFPTFVRRPQTRSTEPSDRGALFQTHISAGHPARHCAGTYWGHPARHATWPCPRAGRTGDDTTDQDRHHGQAPPTAEHSPVTCTRTDSRQNPPGDTQHKISAINRNSGLRTLSGRPGSCCPQTTLEAADWLQRRRWCPRTAACRPGCLTCVFRSAEWKVHLWNVESTKGERPW